MTTAAEEAISLSKPSTTSPNDGDEQANRGALTSTSSSCTPPPTLFQQQHHVNNHNNVLVMTQHEPAVAAADPAILAILPAPPHAAAANVAHSSAPGDNYDDYEEEVATAAPTVKYRYPLEFLLKLKDAPLAQEKPTALLGTSGSGNSATSSGTPLSCFIDSPGGQQTSAGESSRWSNCRGGDRGNQNNDRDRDSGRSRGDRSEIGSGSLITRGGGGDRSGGLGGLAGQDIRLEPDGYRRRPGDPQRRSFNTGCFVPLTSSRRTHSPTPPGGSGTGGSTSVTSGGKLTNEQSDRTIGGGERERESGGRRIGSGRILPYLEKGGGGGGERDDALEGGGGYGDGGRGSYGGRGGRRDMGGDRVDVVADRYDRRSVFSRNTNNNSSLDYDNANSSQDNTQRNSSNSNNNHPSANNNNKSQQSRTIISNRYEQLHSGGYQPRSGNNRRMMDQREIEEPEWFSSGPISQHDTIELRGFDDSDKTPKKLRHPAHTQKKKTIGTTSNNSTNSVVNNQRNNSTGKENENSSANVKEIEADKCSSEKPAQRGSPNLHKGRESIDDKNSLIGQGDKLDKVPSSSNLVQNDDLNNSFSLDEILKLDIPDVLTNGVESVGGSAASSRFSRWFQQNKSPPPPRADSPQLQQQAHQVADDYLRSLIGDDQHQSHGGLLSGLNPQQSFAAAAAASMQQHQLQQPNQHTHQQHPLHISAPGDSDSYFAPISPASTQPGFPYQQQQHNYQQHQHYQQQQAGTNTLADMLQGRSGANNRTNADSAGNDVRRGVLGMATPPGSKVFSLEELEGNIKGTAAMMMSQQQQQQKHAMLHRAQHQHVAPSQPPLTPNQQQHNKGVEDVDAFKRMMEQAGHGQTNGPSSTNTLNPQQQQSKSNATNNANNKPPPTLMEMLAQSQPQSHSHSAQQQLGNHQPELSHFTSNQSHYTSKQQQMDYHLKQQQQQQQQLLNNMIYNNQQQQQTSGRISPDMRSVCREIVQRPETQALLQGLKRGDISPAHIYQQLGAASLQPRQREALQIALKQHVASTAINAAAALPTQQQQPPVALPVVGSPGGGTSPQPQWSQQLRLSPLPPQGVNPFCVSPVLATSSNTLGVPALHKRIPSPYELQVHTQNIMQRALIKKKLEEQQENYRKKQEAAASSGTGSGRDLSPSTSSIATSTTATILPSAASTALSVGQQQPSTITSQMQQQQQMQHHKAAPSPTPTIAFTPTSVLRKMTADKDDAAMAAMINATAAKIQQQQQQQQQGRAVIGNMRAQQPQPGSITSQWGLFQQASKPVGRPIVKSTQNDPTGSYTSQQQQASLISNQQHQEQFFQQQRMLHQQQQQQQKWNQYYSQQQQQQQNQQQQQLFGSAGQHQLTPQQLRAQQQNIRAQHQHQQGSGNQRVQQGWAAMFADQQTTNSQHQLGRSIGRDTSNSNSSVGGCAGGDLSPTSNQLAKWFSPDLLERARNGKCPVLPNPALAKRALNVEDVEQQRRRRGSGNVLNTSAAAGDN